MSDHLRDVTPYITPEEAELAAKRALLEELEAILVERELELATLSAELLAFEQRYYRWVGTRLARLDEIEAEIAEMLARANPGDTTARARAEEARRQANDSASANPEGAAEAPAGRFEPSPELRLLYRNTAKMIHPDLCSDDGERQERTRLMAELTEAYRRGDMEEIERIQRRWAQRPEAVPGSDTAAELVRTLRRIALVRERLDQVEREITTLRESELYRLKVQVEQAEDDGAQPLATMAAELDRQIAEAEERLAAVRGEVRP